MLAIAAQCFVLQTHVHVFAPAQEASLSAHQQDAPDGLSACSICRLGVSARVFTAPPEVALPIAPAFAIALAPLALDQSVRLLLRPAWRSRAPPFSLR
jgi:hypothetical protein